MIIERDTKKTIQFLSRVVEVSSEEDLDAVLLGGELYNDSVLKIPEALLESKKLHYIYFLGKEIMISTKEDSDIASLFLNPMISYLNTDKEIDLSLYSSKKPEQSNIQNIICHIDLGNILENTYKSINDVLDQVWGYYMAYNIYNFPKSVDNAHVYEKLANHLGVVRKAHPVNDKTTKFSNSRDIKYNPEIPHYYASNSRQPLHTDYAYYHKDSCPDWLMLYCIKPSEFGGITYLLSTVTLNKILEKYNKKLLTEIINTDIVYEYKGEDGDRVHTKSLYDGKFINWNFYQIKDKLNNKNTNETRDKFFEFLEETVVAGQMFDFSKKWSAGDCIVFNDHLMLHGRSSFLGDRWLKDHAFYDKGENNG